MRGTHASTLLAKHSARCAHLEHATSPEREGTYEILFDTFGAFFAAQGRQFGDRDKMNTAALAFNTLRQKNCEFGAYYADFQELIDAVDHADDSPCRHVLTRGFSHEMQKGLAI